MVEHTSISPDEAKYLANYDPSQWPAMGFSVDLALLTIRNGRLAVLLIERDSHPFLGYQALPGGFVDTNESIDDAARRKVTEKTGLDSASWHIEQLQTYGDPGRDPRMRVVSVAYLCFMPIDAEPVVPGARFWAVEDLVGSEGPTLAFDHAQIIADAVERCRAKIEYTTLATSFLDEPFTLGDLRRVYEAVWGTKLRPPNFSRKVRSVEGFVIPIPGTVPDQELRPLYKRGPATEVMPPLTRPTADGDT